MNGYPLLAARLYNTPLLIEAGKAQVIESVFRAHVEGNQAELPPFEAKQHVAPAKMARTDDGYLMAEGGVAVLQIYGTLVQRAGGLDALSGLTGYNQIGRQLQAALADTNVLAIVLEIDSPGGEAAGVFDLAGQIMGATKPIVAHANEAAFSAAYALASAASEGLYLPDSGMVGSVGVVLMHVDQSKMDEKRGLVYTPIYAGAKKIDYSSHAPLSDRARASAQEGVDHLYEIFVNHVAVARGISAEVVKKTEAGLLRPGQAIDIGMATGVATLSEVIASMQEKVSKAGVFADFYQRRAGAHSSKGANMAQHDKDAPANNAATEQQLATARADGVTEGIQKGRAEGATAERARVKSILTCDAAKDRTKLAQHLAFDTDQSIDAATALLANAGVEATAKPANALDVAMRGTNPAVGTGPDQSGNAPKPPKSSSQVYDMRRKAVGSAQK